MNLITKYKIFENENIVKLTITEDFIKSIFEKEIFDEKVIEYFKSNGYPFYPSDFKYSYNYEEDEDEHILNYEFENTKLGIVTILNFTFSLFSTKADFFRLKINIYVDFIKEKTPFKNININPIYKCNTWDDILKKTKVGKILKDKKDNTLIYQTKQVLKKTIKENLFKYGVGHLSIKEIVIIYKFVQEIEKLPFVKDYSGVKDYPNKKNYKLVNYEESEIKGTNPWVYEYNEFIMLYFNKFNKTFVFHEQYMNKLKKIYLYIKKEVENEFNN